MITFRDDELTRQELAEKLDSALSPARNFGDVDDTFDRDEPTTEMVRHRKPARRVKCENMKPGNRAQVRRKANSPW